MCRALGVSTEVMNLVGGRTSSAWVWRSGGSTTTSLSLALPLLPIWKHPSSPTLLLRGPIHFQTRGSLLRSLPYAPSCSTLLHSREHCRRSHLPLSPIRAFVLGCVTMDNKSAASHPSTTLSSDGIDEDKGVGHFSAGILPHILNMYNCTSTALDYEIYAVDGTFEDPLMCAHGVKQIKSAFYSIPKVFSEAKIGEYTVHEHETSPGNGEITIDNVQHYKLWGKQIDMVSLIKLQVKDGKVVRHEDLWDKKPLWSRDTIKVPLVGRVVEQVRRGNMLVTHVLMGCGKDHRPKVS